MNMDVGEMFHNFPLNDDVRAFCDVNLSRNAFQGGSKKLFRWTRQWMGHKPSPYNYVRCLALAIEDCFGDYLHADNPLHWDKVSFHLPCAEDFNPDIPWIYKLNSSLGIIVPDVVTLMDEMRITGFSMENCLHSARRFSSRFLARGIQEDY